MVRAKFTVECIKQDVNGKTIELKPVLGGSEENEKFYKYTPSGSIILSTINEEASKQFEVGKEYYIDFTSAE